MLAAAAIHVAVSAAAAPSLRAFSAPPAALTSASTVQRAVASAVAGGFDTVILPVAIGARDAAAFDGAAELLRQAREKGIRTHLALAVNLAATAGELPWSREHVIYQHPEWLMVPRQLAAGMLKIDARSPAYLGQLARWTRANADRVDGLYLSPIDPGATSYLVEAVLAAVNRYAADGVFLSSIDLPGRDFDYSRRAMELFRARMRATLPASERTRLDDIEAIDPFAYTEEFPDEWARFRETAVTQVLSRLRTALTTVRPGMAIAAAVRGDAEMSLRDHFQDWRSWLDRGLVDRVGPRRATSPAVVLSADGVQPLEVSMPVSTAQAGVGGPR